MRDKVMNTNQVMRQVIYALALGVAVQVYFFGFSVLVQIALAIVTALSAEALVLRMRGMQIAPSLNDGSAVLTAVLLAIAIPSIAPWWIIVLGVLFAIVFGKQLFGGLGNNPFNPAMLGYAFLLISYPLQMTQWPSEFQGVLGVFEFSGVDVLTGATNLDYTKTQLMLGQSIDALTFESTSQMWINFGFLLGGVYLLLRRIVFWHIPLSLILGLVLMSGILYLIDPANFSSPTFHLINGATMLAAFFIATDPVSASTTPMGRLIYGFAIGVIIVVIRVFGGYPDAVAFAVLLMNITVPLIDYYTQPKVFGK
ncbi:MAG: RnfABCDGE type electron transport complex subunit D [Gammaproteobacteria bacterium]|nr:RnfABCDGE type electron transport complex subunit D [Gammaproteobacteria bacterium]